MDVSTTLWKSLASGWVAFLLPSLLVLIGGIIFFRWVSRSLQARTAGEDSLWFKLLAAIQMPGHLLIVTLAFRVGLEYADPAKVSRQWVLGGNLLLSFAGALVVGEIMFALLIDYYLRRRHETEVPSIFQQLLKVIVYGLLGLSFLSTTYRIDITPLLTTSAVFTMVIGLALQDVLGNLFSGISVHISPPFKIGDWIKVGGHFGRVTESNWRATTLRSPERDIIILPNNEIAKKDIVNMSQRPGLLYNDFVIGISYEASPDQVRRALLGACSQVKEICRNPAPRVFMDGFQDFSITYHIRYWFKDGHSPKSVRDQLTSRIWYRLKRDGITIPFPIREVNIHPEKDKKAEQIDRRLALLSQVDFLRDLERPNRVFLADRLKEFWYEAGETIVQKGSTGTDFFIIDRGRVAVFLDDEATSPVAELGSGQFFGEMSLLTGEPRTATVRAEEETLLLVLGQETMSHLLRDNPELATLLSRVLAERSARNQMVQASSEATSLSIDEVEAERRTSQASNLLLDRIRRFFRLM
ncbi:MAG: Small-conductance mechanosensitive channel [Candidatus Ozemobacter sibiricus]|jgi:small-conductance mechanosensitive channel/CRP-like cAMP-binding protein|uniref:Small-conductance mechanosensitive channel n=1 Tax=Candidatus Ozemobacter sibiricus TaxID=2268124 RepID=A0A367ZTY3_9BACT|nr:MAG: Small-conductance mechanosensitive channel [Candidatus Ozemobacter sibiricus]